MTALMTPACNLWEVKVSLTESVKRSCWDLEASGLGLRGLELCFGALRDPESEVTIGHRHPKKDSSGVTALPATAACASLHSRTPGAFSNLGWNPSITRTRMLRLLAC